MVLALVLSVWRVLPTVLASEIRASPAGPGPAPRLSILEGLVRAPSGSCSVGRIFVSRLSRPCRSVVVTSWCCAQDLADVSAALGSRHMLERTSCCAPGLSGRGLSLDPLTDCEFLIWASMPLRNVGRCALCL